MLAAAAQHASTFNPAPAFLAFLAVFAVGVTWRLWRRRVRERRQQRVIERALATHAARQDWRQAGEWR
jgi:hypothetical protein